MSVREVNRPSGFSLLELMLAMVLAGTLSAAVMAIFLSSTQEQLSVKRQAQLNHNLRSSFLRVVSELKRAGGVVYPSFDSATDFVQRYQANPFMSERNTLTLGGRLEKGFYDCVIFSYDRNGDGLVGVSSNPLAPVFPGENTANMEQLGFRLNDGALEARMARSRISNTAFSCEDSGGRWSDLTEAEVTVTGFGLAWLDEQGNPIHSPERMNITHPSERCRSGEWCLEVRQLMVTLSAEVAGLAPVSVNTVIRVRNDRVFEY